MFWRDKEIIPGASWDADLAFRDKFKQLIALRRSTPDMSSHPTKVFYASNHLLVLQRGVNTLLVVNRSKEWLDWPVQLEDKESWKLVFCSALEAIDSLNSIGPIQSRIYTRAK